MLGHREKRWAYRESETFRSDRAFGPQGCGCGGAIRSGRGVGSSSTLASARASWPPGLGQRRRSLIRERHRSPRQALLPASQPERSRRGRCVRRSENHYHRQSILTSAREPRRNACRSGVSRFQVAHRGSERAPSCFPVKQGAARVTAQTHVLRILHRGRGSGGLTRRCSGLASLAAELQVVRLPWVRSWLEVFRTILLWAVSRIGVLQRKPETQAALLSAGRANILFRGTPYLFFSRRLTNRLLRRAGIVFLAPAGRTSSASRPTPCRSPFSGALVSAFFF